MRRDEGDPGGGAGPAGSGGDGRSDADTSTVCRWRRTREHGRTRGLRAGLRLAVVGMAAVGSLAGGGARLAAAEPVDGRWDDRFTQMSLDGEVRAVAVSEGGELYIGGDFTWGSGTSLNHVAKWDATNACWLPLGIGLDQGGTVYAIATSGSDVYIGGSFAVAGGVTASHVAKWNGSNWTHIGPGVNGSVYALAISGGELFAGGDLLTPGGSLVGIQKWDGNAWASVGSGVNGSVSALAVRGTDVFVGGDFTVAGGGGASRVARWDGQAWTGLGAGVGHRAESWANVAALAVSGNDLYVGGYFTRAGTTAATNVARWSITDGEWSSMGGLINGVRGLGVSSNGVLAVGEFWVFVGGVLSVGMARWDGASWSPFGNGSLRTCDGWGSTHAIAIAGSQAYVGGRFNAAGGVRVDHAARLDTATGDWSGLGAGTDNSPDGGGSAVHALALHGGLVYAGGTFSRLDTVALRGLATWNGGEWIRSDTGMNGAVAALAPVGSNLVVGGSFSFQAGNDIINNAAVWDPVASTWMAMGSGLDNAARSIAVSGDDVYVGGGFTTAGGVGAANVARWNMAAGVWTNLGEGVDGEVAALAADGAMLYAGGAFTSAGGVAAHGVAVWNGSGWSELGGGVDGAVNAVAVDGSGVYVGGSFWAPWGVFDHHYHLARWDGRAWSDMELNDTVTALACTSGAVYATGDFTEAGGVAVHRIARWDGVAWTSLGSGVGAEGRVAALAIADSDLYLGGDFLFAGGKPSYHFAHWVAMTNVPGQAPVMTEHPVPQTVRMGQPVAFRVAAEGSPPLNYQWRKDETNLSDDVHCRGTDRAELTLVSALLSDAGGYRCVVSNDFGSATSDVASLTVELSWPVITQPPSSQKARISTDIAFSVAATGAPPLMYQWRKDDVDLADDGHYAGAGSNTLTVYGIVEGDAGGYRCVVSNEFGAVTSEVATLTVKWPLECTVWPPNGARCAEGGSQVFGVRVSGGTPPYACRWDNGATGMTLTVEAPGNYGLTVEDADGDLAFDVAHYTLSEVVPDAFHIVNSNGVIYAAVGLPEGKVLIGGYFSSINGEARQNLARLNADGSLDPSYHLAANNGVRTFYAQPDGKILIGGWFTELGGTNRVRIARLNADGDLDLTFDPGSGAGNPVYCFRQQADGKILIGGDFSTFGGVSCSHLARLNADGSVDTSFTAGADSLVRALALQPDGKILVGGFFQTLAGQPCRYLGRLGTNGAFDATFAVSADGLVSALLEQLDGKIVAGGYFMNLNSRYHWFIGRLNADGSVDAGFPNSFANNAVTSLCLQPGGKVLLGGYFTSIGLETASYHGSVGRLNADGSVDTNFTVGADGVVYQFAAQAGGAIVVAGAFKELGGQPRDGLGRLSVCGSVPLTCSAFPSGATICACDSQTFTAHPSGGTPPYEVVWSTGGSSASITVSAPGMYTATVFDAVGSNVQCAVELKVNPVPDAPVVGNNGVLVTGETLLLTASTIPRAAYDWSGPGGFTSVLQNPVISNVTRSAGGTYHVTATVDGCTSTAGTTTVTINLSPHDAWREKFFTPSQLTNAAISGDDANPDGDACLNVYEYIADTDPTNPQSFFRVLAVSNTPPAMRFYFEPSTARTYTLRRETSVLGVEWPAVDGQSNIPGSHLLWMTDSNAPSPAFYRIGVSLP